MQLSLFLSTFAVIFLAELPDKTAFATLLLASQGRASAVFVGVALAFLLQTLVAVAFGQLIGLAPERWLQFGTAILFFAFAAYVFLQKSETAQTSYSQEKWQKFSRGFLLTAWQAFLFIFIAEWGDLTQLATASLVAKNNSQIQTWTIFLAAVAALWSVTLIAILVGQRLSQHIDPARLRKMSAFVFAGIGIYYLSKCV